ncbi:hypothetical protein [Arabiibacter massiliensis]|uniref:hypothetical protein n=1 Tax=Arabiibacter massiliensis TaxID=1870985 RepID=UPI00117A1380|nr:hypothetical protein [Arabiibacter massiliensis]
MIGAVVALAWALAIALALPAGEGTVGLAVQFAAYLVLSFLLVNALRRRMSLRSACAMAVIAACLLIAWSEAVGAIVLDRSTPDTMVPGLVGAIVGSALSFPVFKRVHRAELARTAAHEAEDER